MSLVHKAIPLQGNSGAVYNLGSETSFDLTGYSGYSNFTEANFLVVPNKGVTGWYGDCMTSDTSSSNGVYTASASMSLPVVTYDSTTGVLTITPSKVTAILGSHGGGANIIAQKTVTVSHNVYLIAGEIQ